jgi:type II secretory pathway pseudopilin PulG
MHRRAERGFSLVEVVIALGLLAGVLIAISGLFIIGAKQVQSGRTSSEAVAVGRTILEEMNKWGFRQTYQIFGYDGATTNYSVDTRTNAYATKWQPLLASNLVNSYATIQLQSLGPGGTPPSMSATLAIRVLVTVNWDEGARHRRVQVGTVRM